MINLNYSISYNIMNELWFIKNTKILDEGYRMENNLDLSKEQSKLFSRISHIETSSIIWLVWGYWEWKSNFLNQMKTLPNAAYWWDVRWFEFDAWKYPERSNLWENFTLEIARQIDSKTFDEAIKKIDWKQNDDKITLLNTIWDIPFLSAIKNFNHFFNTSPARRTFEIQNILSELFSSIDSNTIFIIIEDIDRSWDSWIFFLETLNHFLKTEQLNKKIIGIVPIGTDSYDRNEIKASYLKSLDYVQEFSIREIGLTWFVEAIFDDEILSNDFHKWQIVSFLESLFKEYPWQMNMRKLKYILRNANSNYIALYGQHWDGIDWRLAIIFESAKHIKNREDELYLNKWRKENNIWSGNNPFNSLISCVIVEGTHVLKRWLVNNSTRYKSIYKLEYEGWIEILRLIGLIFTMRVLFHDIDYKTSQNKDHIFYHHYDYPSNKEKNYFSILRDYLYI